MCRTGSRSTRADFLAGDFWPQISHLKRDGARFDCVIVDPPLFSRTRQGTVDLVEAGQRVLNKVRPLIADGGTLVTINNALFVSGASYLKMLEALCADGYLTLETPHPRPPGLRRLRGTAARSGSARRPRAVQPPDQNRRAARAPQRRAKRRLTLSPSSLLCGSCLRKGCREATFSLRQSLLPSLVLNGSQFCRSRRNRKGSSLCF